MENLTLKQEDELAKAEMEMRFELSGLLRGTINKSDNGEIALPDFLDELELCLQKGRTLLTNWE